MLMLTYHIMRAVNAYRAQIVCIIDLDVWTPPIGGSDTEWSYHN